jgi:glycosyltransferase involved in cell wall biosynthesis
MKKVSVIIPVFNAGKYLVQAVNSILVQTYLNIEVIIVNDGSTDDSMDVLSKNFAHNNRIVIISTENRGQSAACNLGYNYATGELIKFFDADDILNNNFIEEQVKLLGDRIDCICSANWGRFYYDNIETFVMEKDNNVGCTNSLEWIINSLESGSIMMQCAMWLIPRQILSNSGLWNESLNLNNDFEFFVRVLLASSKILKSENSILYYRSGNSSTLSQILNRKAYESGVKSNILGTSYLVIQNDSHRVRMACVNNLKIWMFNTYVEYPDLSKLIENTIDKWSPNSVVYRGSKFAVGMSYVLGWKVVVLLSHWKRKLILS